MVLRFVAPLIALGALLSGCFEPRCGPHQELSRGDPGEQKLHSGVCVCVEGRAFDENLNCVKPNAPTGPAPEVDAGTQDGATAAPMVGGCDMTTGLGCACKSDAECANYPADYCVVADPADAEKKRACLYQGCDMPGKECPSSQHCCTFPFAPQGTICLPEDRECPFK